MGTVALKLICCLFCFTLSLFLGNILPPLLRANDSIISEQMCFSEMRKGGGHGAVEEEGPFRAMGKGTDNISTEAIKAFVEIAHFETWS